MNDQQFFDNVSRELHSHFLTIENDAGSSLEDVFDIDDIIDDIMDIFKNNINRYISE